MVMLSRASGRMTRRAIGRGGQAGSTGPDLYVNSREELDALLIANGVAEADVVSTWDAIWPVLIDPDTGVEYASAEAADNQIYNQGGILKADIVAAIPPAEVWYGNLDTPYTQTTYFDEGSFDHAVFWKVDLGSSVSGAISQIEARISEIDTGSKEIVFSLYSHHADDRPNVVIASSGRHSDSGVTSWDTVNLTTPDSISEESVVWIAIFCESSPQFNTRIGYEPGVGERLLVVELSGTEWIDDSGVGGNFINLTNYAASLVSPYTDRKLEARFLVS